MKKTVMKKWVKALRSDKFKQGRGTLKQYNRQGDAQHCCLGVLCELYNQDMVKKKKKKLSEKVISSDSYSHSSFLHGFVEFNRSRDCLPKKVTEWAGIKNKLGYFVYKNYKDGCLADLNDDGTRFKSIANIIEKNWENL